MPLAARRSPSHCELVSGICPKSSSVPTATISTRTRHNSLARVVVLQSGVDGQHYRQPDRYKRERRVVSRDGQHREANGPVLDERLPLGEAARGNGDAVLGGACSIDTHADLARGDDDGRNDKERHAVGTRQDNGVQPTQHDDLVGQGIKERARGRRAVTSRDDAVEVVRRGDRQTYDDRPPGDAIEDQQIDEEWRDDESKTGHHVGRRQERARAIGALRAHRTTASKSVPWLATLSTSTIHPTTSES